MLGSRKVKNAPPHTPTGRRPREREGTSRKALQGIHTYPDPHPPTIDPRTGLLPREPPTLPRSHIRHVAHRTVLDRLAFPCGLPICTAPILAPGAETQAILIIRITVSVSIPNATFHVFVSQAQHLPRQRAGSLRAPPLAGLVF